MSAEKQPINLSTPNERLAFTAESILSLGPMGNNIRGDDYQAFLDRTFGVGRLLRSKATSCAIFIGGCLIDSGVKAKRGWPAVMGIVTWIGVGWFGSEPSWIPADELNEPIRGDIPYWCSDQGKMGEYVWTRWEMAANGHVGTLTIGAGPIWYTAEGGGSPGGTVCRLSSKPKNIQKHYERKLRGVWRPNLMV